MAIKTDIGWTATYLPDGTVLPGATQNFWQGCIHISPGCENCYMYREKARYGQDGNDIHRSSNTTFNAPYKWNKQGPRKVFTCSWSDFFLPQADDWRTEAWKVIKETPNLTYLVLTKRPGLITTRLPDDWGDGYDNVWLGTTVESQDYMFRAAKLATIPAKVRFLSLEPLLGPLDLSSVFEPENPKDFGKLHWVITGGESGPKDVIRKADLDWFRSIRDQAHNVDIPVFHKQHGGPLNSKIDGVYGGRMLDGQYLNEFPLV